MHFGASDLNGKQSCAGCCNICQSGSLTKTLNVSDARRPQPTITFNIVDNTSVMLSIAFYSQNRFQTGWPGWDRSWTVVNHENTYTLSCQAGERICFGAWPVGDVNSSYWGVGPRNQYPCKNCCYVCDGGTYTKSLTD
jgi:hypothetical protein